MQRTYFQGLKKKPTFDEIVGYLDTDQQFMAHPDRTYTRLKNDQYYSNLNMAGVNSINAQSDNLLKEQARQLDRTKQMQNLGLSQPQADAADIASGMGTPMGQQPQPSQPSQRPQRPFFLPDHDPSDITPAPTSGWGSAIASGHASPLVQSQGDPFELMDRLDELQKKQEANAEAKRRRVQDKVEAEALDRDSAKATLTGIYGRVRQPSIIPEQIAEIRRRRSAEHRSGSPVAQNRGTSPYQAKPRASSEGSRVRTLSDPRLGDAGQPASSSKDLPTVSEGKFEGKFDFTKDTKEIGQKMTEMGDAFKYWNGKLSVPTIREQFKMRKDLSYDATKNKIHHIAELINYDMSKGGKLGRAVIDGNKIIIQQPQPLTQFADVELQQRGRKG